MTSEERTILRLNEELDHYKEEYALLCRTLDGIANELSIAYYWSDSAIHNGEHYHLVSNEILRKVRMLKQDRVVNRSAWVVSIVFVIVMGLIQPLL